jgi:adenine-specific DNA-methyltransferase
MKNKMTEGKIIFPKKTNGRPREKVFLNELTTDGAGFSTIIEDLPTSDGTQEIRQIFGKQIFNFPKPTNLIARLIDQVSTIDSIVLDSFAGSGTTAHAVMKLNAEDGGNRRFILVEMEDYAESLTAERVRRASSGYGEGDKAVAGLGSGFSYYELGPRLFDESGFAEDAPRSACRSFIWYAEVGAALAADAADADGPFLGEKGGTAYYLIEGSFGKAALRELRRNAEAHVVYAYATTFGPEFLASRDIVFKKMPRDLPVEGSRKWS